MSGDKSAVPKALKIRRNFHAECEDAINKQINMELSASYAYLALASQFQQQDVALKGFHKFFQENSDEERQHAMKFMRYLADRGGRVQLASIQPPPKYNFSTGIDAMECALELELDVNESLLKLHKLASTHEDPHLADFISEVFLKEQVESIKQIGDYITNLKSAGPGIGELQFDKLYLQ